MTAILQSRLDRLAKSTQNVVNAKNPAQREAAETFLIQRAQELIQERKEREEWLHEADTWLNQTMPQINTDADHEHNQEWLQKLGEYESICNALSDAWDAYMEATEAA